MKKLFFIMLIAALAMAFVAAPVFAAGASAPVVMAAGAEVATIKVVFADEFNVLRTFATIAVALTFVAILLLGVVIAQVVAKNVPPAAFISPTIESFAEGKTGKPVKHKPRAPSVKTSPKLPAEGAKAPRKKREPNAAGPLPA